MSLRRTEKLIKIIKDEIADISSDAYENLRKASDIRTQLKNWGNGAHLYSTLAFAHLGEEVYLGRLNAFRLFVVGDKTFLGIRGIITFDPVSDIDPALFQSLCNGVCRQADGALAAFELYAPPNRAGEKSASDLRKEMRELARQLYAIDEVVDAATRSFSVRHSEREKTLTDDKARLEKKLEEQQNIRREALRQWRMPTTLIAAFALLISFGALAVSVLHKPAVTVEVRLPQKADDEVAGGRTPLPTAGPGKSDR